MNFRKLERYTKGVTNVMKRDKHCQLSWHSKCDMVVHHIIPFSKLVKDWREADDLYKESYYERIFDEDNMIMITEELHRKFHRKYWNHSFTKADFDEWRKSIEYISLRDLNVTEEVIQWDGCRPLTVISVGV